MLAILKQYESTEVQTLGAAQFMLYIIMRTVGELIDTIHSGVYSIYGELYIATKYCTARIYL